MFSKNEQAILACIRERGRVGLSAIARDTNIAKSSVHAALRNLGLHGVVTSVLEKGTNQSLFQMAARDQLEAASHSMLKTFREAVYGTGEQAAKPSLVFTDQYVLPDSYLQQLRTKFKVTAFDKSPHFMTEELFELRSKNADVIVRFDAPRVDNSYLRRNPHVRAIVCPTCFHNEIDLAACEAHGVIVKKFDATTQRYYGTSQLEYVLNALLTLLRPLGRAAHATSKAGSYHFGGYLGPDLSSRRVGLIFSESNIASFIDVFHALGCDVRAASTLHTPPPPAQFGLYDYSDMESLWRSSDVVVFIDNIDMSIDHLLSLSPNPEYLVIATVGVHYDVAAMRRALLARALKGLAIDCLPNMFATESHSSDLQTTMRPLINLPNVLITPELGMFSEQSLELSYRYTFDILMDLELS